MTEAGPAAVRDTSGPMGAAGARGNTTEKRCNRHTRQKRIHRYISGITNPNELGTQMARKSRAMPRLQTHKIKKPFHGRELTSQDSIPVVPAG
jgi:hypothetical protein